MKNLGKTRLKVTVGLVVSLVFLYLAFGKIDVALMKRAFLEADFRYFIPAGLATLIGHWLRCVRWRIFLKSLKEIRIATLFSATMIAYMGNTFLPAHLGEVFRANVVGNREKIPTSAVFATIVIERILDMLSLLLIMVLALLVHPFPQIVIRGGYVMFAGTSGLLAFLVFLKLQTQTAVVVIRPFLSVLPQTRSQRLEDMILAFIEGISKMDRKRDYVLILFHTALIWFCYLAAFYFVFYSFNLFQNRDANIMSSLVTLVITTISIVIPSSPGYIGTYHYFCQFSLKLFDIPGSIGLSVAFVAWGLSTLPAAILGLAFAWREGWSRLKKRSDNQIP